MKPNNPFLISGYYSPEFFCDREQETGTILDALHNGRNVTLIAPRRMGKTGLVRHAFYRLKAEQPDIVTFYLDIYSRYILNPVIRRFCKIVCQYGVGAVGLRSAKGFESDKSVCPQLPSCVYF